MKLPHEHRLIRECLGEITSAIALFEQLDWLSAYCFYEKSAVQILAVKNNSTLEQENRSRRPKKHRGTKITEFEHFQPFLCPLLPLLFQFFSYELDVEELDIETWEPLVEAQV